MVVGGTKTFAIRCDYFLGGEIRMHFLRAVLDGITNTLNFS